jgi:hypothetical protein
MTIVFPSIYHVSGVYNQPFTFTTFWQINIQILSNITELAVVSNFAVSNHLTVTLFYSVFQTIILSGSALKKR